MKKVISMFATGILLSIVVVLICTFFGSADISLRETLMILANKIFGIQNASLSDMGTKAIIIWKVRFPRTLLAFLVGGILAVCGAVYQAIFRNPMADPFVLGISSGAAFGATFGILFAIPITFVGMNIISVLAFISAVMTIFFVYNIAKVGRHAQLTSLLLTGIAVNQFLTAIISFAMLFSHDQMKEIYFWTLGSFSGKGWDQFLTVLPYAIVGYILIFIHSRDLDIIMLGDESAIRFGVETEKVKSRLFFITALMMAACVSVSGIIGFVGLIAPHIIRLFSGPIHKHLLPLSFFLGGILLSICDTLSRTIMTGSEIPVGLVTAILGAPFFIYLLRAKRAEVI